MTVETEKDGGFAHRYTTRMLFGDLYRFLQPQHGRYLAATLLRATGDVLRLYPPYAIATIVNLLSQQGRSAQLRPILFLLGFSALAYAGHVTGRQLAKLIGYRVAERVALRAQQETITHLFALDLSWHERENSGNKLKRMQHGGEGINQILRMWITNFIEVGVNFVGITVIFALFDLRISLLVIGFMVIYFLISRFFMVRASSAELLVNRAEEEFFGLAFESVNNIRSVKVLGMAQALKVRIRSQIADLFSKIRRRIFWYQSRDWVLVLFGRLFSLSMLLFVILGILSGRYELGLLVLFWDYFSKIWENIEELSMVLLDFVIAKVRVSRMQDILREPVVIDRSEGKREFPPAWNGIAIKDLSFGYRPGAPVLKNLSLSIRRGERIGIVGASGAGKSTLFKLLLKEHEAYEGEIFVGDTPLRDIRRSSFFGHAAVVLQETEVFNFSLRDNITLANPDHAGDEALLKRAIEIAHVTDFLEKLPEGLLTLIGEKGVKLSGGEKQRLGIARAIFKSPSILFLDEATSHLDLESEEKIRDSLHRFFSQVTAIVIAHRLSTIREMDRIFVLEGGSVAESGSFEELKEKKGRFWELWRKQKL